MSDEETGSKKTGYRLEYAKNARAKCKGPKPCNGTMMEKGSLRLGTLIDFQGHSTFAWRHWGCVTPKIISNFKRNFDNADDLDGFEELKEEDQERVRKAWEVGHVAEEDIPESARKPADDDEEDDEAAGSTKKKSKTGGSSAKASKKSGDDAPGVFKLEYASSGRAKCKDGCDATIAKDYLRLGHEVDFRGNKSFAYQHWGCVTDKVFAKLKKSYTEAEKIDGFADLQEDDKEKVLRAWEEGSIPTADKGVGEPAQTVSKKASGKAKKADAAPPKKKARRSKDEDEDEDEGKDDADDYEEEAKPKAKRAPAKKAKAPVKKRVSKKKDEDEDEDEGEDFTAEMENVSDDEEHEEEEEESPKKRKRAPASKSSSKPASKAKKPTSKKAAAKPSSSRKRKQAESDDD